MAGHELPPTRVEGETSLLLKITLQKQDQLETIIFHTLRANHTNAVKLSKPSS